MGFSRDTEVDELPESLVGAQYGVWRLVRPRENSWKTSDSKSLWASLTDLQNAITMSKIPRFLYDIYSLAPWIFMTYTLTFAFLGINEALKLQLLNQLLEHVSASLFAVAEKAYFIISRLNEV